MSDLRTSVGLGLRRTIEAYLDHDTDDEGLQQAATLLQQVREVLNGPTRPRYYERDFSRLISGGLDPFLAYLDETPFGGGSHPISPPGTIELVIDTEVPSVVGTVTAGRAYEGPARCVHGGFVAGLFDHFLGMAQNAYNRAHNTLVFAATRELKVQYRKPTPLDTELTFRSRLDEVDERTFHGHATCHAGDVLTATAEAVFTNVGADRILSTSDEGFSSQRKGEA